MNLTTFIGLTVHLTEWERGFFEEETKHLAKIKTIPKKINICFHLYVNNY